MDFRRLGRSGVSASVLSLGTISFGATDPKGPDLREATRLIDIGLDAGINLIDTADIYSLGTAEELVGAAIRGRRDRMLLATKARMALDDGVNSGGLSRLHLIRACEASLRRLGTDYIDLYQVHEWDGQTPLAETLETLDLLIRDGKVRYIGASNYTAWQLMKALGVSDQYVYQRFITHQIHYSLHAREAEYELLPQAIDQHLGVLVWSPLAAGLLSGAYRRNQGTEPSTVWGFPPVRDVAALYDLVDALLGIADTHSMSPAQIALAWLLGRPAVTSLIIGPRNGSELGDCIAALDVRLTDAQRLQLDMLTLPVPIYPHWHQAQTARDRLSEGQRLLLSPYFDDQS